MREKKAIKHRNSTLTGSQQAMLAQSALSTAFFSIGTGNFLAGYLLYLGARPAYCAVVAALQNWLSIPMGIRSIDVLFACTGIFCLTAVLTVVVKLPKIVPGEE